MTTSTVQQATSTTVNGAHLRTMIQAALTVAKAADKSLPALRQIKVVLDYNQVVVLASDRHVAYRGSFQAQGDSVAASFMLDIESAAAAVQLLPSRGPVSADFGISADGVVLNYMADSIELVAEANASETFPAVERIFERAAEAKVTARGGFAVAASTLATALAVCKVTKWDEPEFRFLDIHGASTGGMMRAAWGDYGYEPEHELLVMATRGKNVAEWTDDAVFAAKRG